MNYSHLPSRHRRLTFTLFVSLALLSGSLSPAPAQEDGQSNTCVPEELVHLRTRDMKVFLNEDCSKTALFGKALHFESTPGQWDDVDLDFKRQGETYVMNDHQLSVRVAGAAIEVTDDEGRGIRWLVPSVPDVNGRRASFRHLGLDWQYTTRITGIKLEAAVDEPVGPSTYDFSYQVLGGASDLAVGLQGDLSSDAFSVPRAVVYGADGQTYEAGVWRVLPSQRVAFDFDDSVLPTEAFPYVLDPTTIFSFGGPDADTFVGGESGDDGTVQAGAAVYPPLAAWADPEEQPYLIVRRDREGISGYRVSNGLVRWDTSALPDTARVLSAEVHLSPVAPQGQESTLVPGCPVVNDDRRLLTADWYDVWPIDTTDYSPIAQTGALAGVYLDQFVGDKDITRALDNPDGVSTTGYTGLRFHISGSEPAGLNSVCFAAFDDTNLPEPRLSVTYVPDPPVVLGAEDAPDPVIAGNEIEFDVSYLAIEPGEGHFALICTSNLVLAGDCVDETLAKGGLDTTTGVASARYWTPPWAQRRTYFAFVCNALSLCSPNWAQGAFDTINRIPTVHTATTRPVESLDPGDTLYFDVDWEDSWGERVYIRVCGAPGLTPTPVEQGGYSPQHDCESYEWARSDSPTKLVSCDSLSPPPATKRCTTTLSHLVTDDEYGTHDFYAYVCDQAHQCSPGSPGAFTVGGQSCGALSDQVNTVEDLAMCDPAVQVGWETSEYTFKNKDNAVKCSVASDPMNFGFYAEGLTRKAIADAVEDVFIWTSDLGTDQYNEVGVNSRNGPSGTECEVHGEQRASNTFCCDRFHLRFFRAGANGRIRHVITDVHWEEVSFQGNCNPAGHAVPENVNGSGISGFDYGKRAVREVLRQYSVPMYSIRWGNNRAFLQCNGTDRPAGNGVAWFADSSG